jgi:plasmid segregation protein ParM
MKVPVFAVDVGFGNTKSAFRMGSDIATKMYPSLTPTAVSKKLLAETYGLADTSTVVTITVDGIDYEVGPGVKLSSANGDAGRTLHNDFCMTDNYAALLGGALHLAGVTEVERLMLGLPVEKMQLADSVRSKYTGSFNFGHGDVKIHSVKVIPQPLGALVSFSAYGGEGGETFDRSGTHLIVDVGYHTTDWVVAEGYAMDERRSGGQDGGASKIYRSIADKIAADHKQLCRGIERIDKCLRENELFAYHGQQIDLKPYLRQCEPQIQATVKAISTSVGDGEEFRSIVLTGGGGTLYSHAIRERYPQLPVVVLEAACFSNAKGFLILGESTLARERKALGVAA